MRNRPFRETVLSAALPAALVLSCSATSAAHAYEIGMGDQKLAMFSDPRFRELGLKHVRRIVSWNVALKRDWERTEMNRWLSGAKQLHQQPMIAFQHAWDRPEYLPSAREFRRAFSTFRRRYPSVRVFTPWNEANHQWQPTARHPRRVASFYNLMRKRCRRCRIVAADVLDEPSANAWIRTFRRHARGRPRLWGLHNYIESNRPDLPRTTDGFLADMPGIVWITETGGLVQRRTPDQRTAWPYDEQRAARATARALEIAAQHPKITRVYLYQWTVDADEDWDSAFIGPDGGARPALGVLREALARGTATRRAAARPPSG
jgi:hypothetical protein